MADQTQTTLTGADIEIIELSESAELAAVRICLDRQMPFERALSLVQEWMYDQAH